MPYSVWIDDAGDSWYLRAETIDEAIGLAGLLDAHPWRSVRVIGEGYDCDMDADGYYEIDDGLTDEERELVEAAGL